MKTKAAILRLEEFIKKDILRKRGYELNLQTNKVQKRGYSTAVSRLKSAIEKKRDALEYLKKNYEKDTIDWGRFCNAFGFKNA